MILFVVRKNTDMTEGRGRMEVESYWFDRNKAVEHMNTQPGIMGRKPRTGSWETEPYGGDWDIKPIEVSDDFPPMRDLKEPDRVVTIDVHLDDENNPGYTLCGVNGPNQSTSSRVTVRYCPECLTLLRNNNGS